MIWKFTGTLRIGISALNFEPEYLKSPKTGECVRPKNDNPNCMTGELHYRNLNLEIR